MVALEERDNSFPSSTDPSPPAPGVCDSGDEQSTIGSLHTNRLRIELLQYGRQAHKRKSIDEVASSLASLDDASQVCTVEDKANNDEDAIEVDGGYGWVVAFGAFLSNFFVSGTIKSYGLLNLMILETYRCSAAESALVVSLLITTSLLVSPVVGALCERFTCRTVVICGGLLCFLGFSLSSLATSITHLCLTIGVLAGLGAGCTTTPGILIATRYFPTRRSMINGLVLAGNSAGSFALPPLFEYLLEEYGLHGTLLLIGAMCLHVVVGGALFRPLAQHEAILRRKRHRKLLIQSQVYKTACCNKDETMTMAHPHLLADQVVENRPSSRASTIDKASLCSVPVAELRRSAIKSQGGSLTRLMEIRLTGQDGQPVRTMVEVPNRLCGSSLMLSTNDVTADATSQFTDDLNKLRQSEPGGRPAGFCRRVASVFDLNLLKNPLFCLLTTSVFFMAVGSPYALVQMPVFVVSRGFTRLDTVKILSIVSAVDLVSRLGLGWLFDQTFFPRHHAFAASQLLAGVAVIFLPLCYSFNAILAMCVVFTIGMSAWYVNLVPVLADHHGIDRVVSSYSLVRMFYGLSTLVAPPLLGVLVDVTSDYGAQYYVMGACTLLAGALCCAILAGAMAKRYGYTPSEKPLHHSTA